MILHVHNLANANSCRLVDGCLAPGSPIQQESSARRNERQYPYHQILAAWYDSSKEAPVNIASKNGTPSKEGKTRLLVSELPSCCRAVGVIIAMISTSVPWQICVYPFFRFQQEKKVRFARKFRFDCAFFRFLFSDKEDHYEYPIFKERPFAFAVITYRRAELVRQWNRLNHIINVALWFYTRS